MVVKLLGNQRSGSDRILKYSPRKVLGKKFHQSLLILKAFNDIVRYKKNFFLEVRDNGSIQCLMCIVKKLAGFKCDQLIPQVIFIFKIQIKSSLCQSGLIYNVGYGCLCKAFSCKKVKCCLKQYIHFQFFIIFYFSHIQLPPL